MYIMVIKRSYYIILIILLEIVLTSSLNNQLLSANSKRTKITPNESSLTTNASLTRPNITPEQNFRTSSLTIDGPPVETKPDYENIVGPLGKLADNIFLTIFRMKMAEKVGVDSSLPKDDFQGLMELTAALNARYSDRLQVQQIAQEVLRACFPKWLPPQFAFLFAGPFPKFSSRMNAWATAMCGVWLMGECEINDCEIDGGGIGEKQGVLVKRCRFMEESGCASVCVNSCKIPTQAFFADDMGLPLTMTPDYETGECQFSFGLTPTCEGEFDAKNTPCLSRCPSLGGMRKWHSRADSGRLTSSNTASPCSLMDD